MDYSYSTPHTLSMGVRYTFHLNVWTEQSRAKLLLEAVKSATGHSFCSVSEVCQSEVVKHENCTEISNSPFAVRVGPKETKIFSNLSVRVNVCAVLETNCLYNSWTFSSKLRKKVQPKLKHF